MNWSSPRAQNETDLTIPRYYRTPPSGDRVAKPGLVFLKAQVREAPQLDWQAWSGRSRQISRKPFKLNPRPHRPRYTS